MGDGSVNNERIVMRPVIFASLALALGTASLSGYACTTHDEYNQNLSQLQENYNGAVGAANKQYADNNIPNVVFFDVSARSSARRYYDTPFYYAEVAKKREHWETWERTVNAALADYMKESQHAYDNYVRTACLWW
jgi:hypothetical protein